MNLASALLIKTGKGVANHIFWVSAYKTTKYGPLQYTHHTHTHTHTHTHNLIQSSKHCQVTDGIPYTISEYIIHVLTREFLSKEGEEHGKVERSWGLRHHAINHRVIGLLTCSTQQNMTRKLTSLTTKDLYIHSPKEASMSFRSSLSINPSLFWSIMLKA